MSWNDFYQRQHAIQAVLDHAEAHPGDRLDPQAVPRARAVFADTDDLVPALQHKWLQLITGRIGVALSEVEDDPHGDRVEAVTAAWRTTATRNPVLRAVLDKHLDEPGLRGALEREQRLLALATGLADHTEPADDIARVGAAFLRLLRGTPDRDLLTSS
ncbi:hypothetical protein [Saccharopolyspora taberi]|uniref:TetR family transcriptional regulator n=1 Tax=Saccharopolyspora taberi TaxID=60895 RepID=A0ABN3VI80_9PSEU